MNYTKRDFIINMMKSKELPYYQVKDEDDKFVLDENNENKNAQSSSESLITCLDSIDGKCVHVRISSKMFRGEEASGGTLKSGCYKYRVKLNSDDTVVSANNFAPNTSNQNLIEMIKILQDENKNILESIRKKEIDDLQNQIAELKENPIQENNVFQNFLMEIGKNFMQIQGINQPVPISDNLTDINTEAMTEQNKINLQRMNECIAILLKHDKNFVNNLENLAKLCQKKPFIYQQAINMLNSQLK